MTPPTTLAEAWEARILEILPDCTARELLLFKTIFYAGAMYAIELQSQDGKADAVLAEVTMYCRTVGREVV